MYYIYIHIYICVYIYMLYVAWAWSPLTQRTSSPPASVSFLSGSVDWTLDPCCVISSVPGAAHLHKMFS